MDDHHELNAGLDATLARLRERAAAWATLPAGEKITLLRACRERVARSHERWTAIAAGIKGVAGTNAAGEEALSGPWGTIRALDAYVRTLRHVESGQPRIDVRRVRARRDGGVAAAVFPNVLFDRLLLPGVEADVWLDSDAALARHDTSRSKNGKVVAVMGAGNVTSIGVLDVLSKLVNDDAVCVLKAHPLLEPLLPVFNDIFAPLIAEGFVATTCGDAGEGAYLANHPLVDAVHVTGSTATHRAIAAETSRPVTAELGNVTPAIVMGGTWSDREIEYVAESLVSAKLHNNGYDCVALQVLVLPAQWPQRADLINAIERVMHRVPERPAYYPGSVARFRDLTRGRTSLRLCGQDGDTQIPPAIVDVDPNDPNEPLFTEEAFCPLFAVATIEGDPATYLHAATRFCNERLSGDLAAHVIAHPNTLREHAAEVDIALAQLRYGIIGLNMWCGVGFLLPEIPWGAAPGNTPAHIGSGVGDVHNAFALRHPKKTVVRAPFRPLNGWVRPPWFVTHRNARAIAAALCEYERRASPLTLTRIAWLAMTG